MLSPSQSYPPVLYSWIDKPIRTIYISSSIKVVSLSFCDTGVIITCNIISPLYQEHG